MTDRDALLRAILAAPGDDLARLVYADWLREQTDPLRVAAGRFLWAGVIASRYRDVRRPIEDDEYWIAVREMGESERQVIPAVVRSVGLECDPKWASETVADRVTVAYLPRIPHRLVFERGMVAGVKGPLESWAAVAGLVLARHPLEWAEVTNVPGMTAHVEPEPDGGWSLTLRIELLRRTPGRRTVSRTTHFDTRPDLVAGVFHAADEMRRSIADELSAG